MIITDDVDIAEPGELPFLDTNNQVDGISVTVENQIRCHHHIRMALPCVRVLHEDCEIIDPADAKRAPIL